jgi:protoheme IX farnesyltransferase
MTTQTALHPTSRISQYWTLTKPRVTQLAVFCAVIGMFLATDGFPGWRVLIAGTAGIWLLAGAAFAVNCLIEAEIDARMARTARRATSTGELTRKQTLVFSGIIGGLGMLILYTLVNPLTMWLTLVTFVGYAVIYTIYLKPATPQNIVIGGLSGAMPPALGWAAVANEVPMEAWLLVLIIFVWTPPHFWALSLYASGDYARAGVPMLPVVAGARATRRQVLLYTLVLVPVSLAPWALGYAGPVYGVSVALLGAGFLWAALLVLLDEQDAAGRSLRKDAPARFAFKYSLLYLFLLFLALAVDHAIGA